VGDADEGIVLTEREREVLAGLAESIGDPWLARQLAGRDQPVPRPKRRPDVAPLLAAAGGWVGLLLVLAGAVLAVTTFARSTLAASLGLVVMGVGVWRLVVERGDDVVRRFRARPEPRSPRRPPGAG
jgi:hypothetical protein